MAADYKVKLVRASTLNLPSSPTKGIERVVFEVTPDFNESRQANYRSVDAVHSPGQIFLYGSTNSRTFSIGAKLISRSSQEATRNLTYVQYLRSWMMPVFGVAGSAQGELLGAPPPVLLLTAYANGPATTGNTPVPEAVIGNTSPGKIPSQGNNIYQVPVVMTSLEIPFPADVDYIPTQTNIPFPIVVSISISLTETHSPKGYQSFSLDMYKAGNLPNF